MTKTCVLENIVGLFLFLPFLFAIISSGDARNNEAKEVNTIMQQCEKGLINSQNAAICDLVRHINNGSYRGKYVVLAHEPPCIEGED
jgi:hypothetical protein